MGFRDAFSIRAASTCRIFHRDLLLALKLSRCFLTGKDLAMVLRERPLGRPPKPPDQKRSASIRIMLLESERDELDRAVERSGGDLSAWARDLLLRAARKKNK